MLSTKIIFRTMTLLLVLPAMMLTTACSSDDDMTQALLTETSADNTEGYPMYVEISASRDMTTRATYDEENRKMKFSEGDKLLINGHHENGDNSAYSFAGILNWNSGDVFSGIIYSQNPYNGSPETMMSEASNTSLNQNNKFTATLLPSGFESVGYLGYSEEYAYSNSLTEDWSKAFVAGDMATGVAQLACERATTYDNGIELKPKNAILFCTVGELTANTSYSFTVNNETNSPSGSVTANENKTVFFSVAFPEDSENKAYQFKKDNETETPLGERMLLAGNIYLVNYPDAIASVDLGLTSGTLWATVNVGASKPEEFGTYVSWAGVTPRDKYIVAYCPYHKWGLLMKYCIKEQRNLGYCVDYDDKTELEACDDVATVQWGNNWCTPTEEQFQELLAETTQKIITKNGVKCMEFTSKTKSTTIILPIAGRYVSDNDLSTTTDKFESENGWYWSKTLNVDKTKYNASRLAKSLRIYDENETWKTAVTPSWRPYGLPVRPVRNSSN